MIYVYGTNTNDHYDFPHSEVVVGRCCAKGLIRAGAPAVALWGGGDCEVDGVPHQNMWAARPTPDDVLLVMHPVQAATVVSDSAWKHLLPPRRRWIYVNAYSPDLADRWGAYDRIFVESPHSLVETQSRFPNLRVHWLMLGCVQDVALDGLPNPYPEGEGVRPLFWAGRLDDRRRDKMLWLVHLLEDAAQHDYVVWCASTDRLGFRHERVVELGPLPHGTFWARHLHAHASLDFGFPAMFPGLNCKVLDALRGGGRVIADGYSFSHYLLGVVGGGEVVPHGDVGAMVRALEAWGPEDLQDRVDRAEAFAYHCSWDVRARELLAMVGGV